MLPRLTILLNPIPNASALLIKADIKAPDCEIREIFPDFADNNPNDPLYAYLFESLLIIPKQFGPIIRILYI